MLVESNVNPTQVVGLLAFSVAALSAAYAATANQGLPKAADQGWWVVCGIHALYVIEIAVGGRHLLHQQANQLLMESGIYNMRSTMQVALLVLCGMSLFAGILWRCRQPQKRMHNNGALRSAFWCAEALFVLFLIETISLHRIDAVLYKSVGPVLLVSYLWALGAGFTVWAAYRNSRSRA